MSIEGRGGLGPQASCSGVLRSGYYTFCSTLSKNAAALGYHGYHIIEDIMDINGVGLRYHHFGQRMLGWDVGGYILL